MKVLPLIVLLLASFSAFADDPRVKSLDDSIAEKRKLVENDLNRAKEKASVEYKKVCVAQVKILETAIKDAERKIGVAKSQSDPKSVEALEGRLSELKDERETWDAGSKKNWAVTFVEASEKEVIPAINELKAAGEARDVQLKAKVIGKWQTTLPDKAVFQFKADGTWLDLAETNGREGKWSIENGTLHIDREAHDTVDLKKSNSGEFQVTGANGRAKFTMKKI